MSRVRGGGILHNSDIAQENGCGCRQQVAAYYFSSSLRAIPHLCLATLALTSVGASWSLSSAGGGGDYNQPVHVDSLLRPWSGSLRLGYS